MGKALEYILPSKSIGFYVMDRFFGFHLNPGPFNFKEHTAIIMTAAAAIDPAYSIEFLSIQRLFFGDQTRGVDGGIDMGWIGSLLLILSTQLIGFGLVGFFKTVLVDPSYCWWPVNLISSNLLYSCHGSETSRITHKRMIMFKLVLVMAILYQFLPGILMPVLQSVAFVCLFSGGPLGNLGNINLHMPSSSPVDSRPFLSQLGSGLNGGGVGSVSFSWESIGILAPLYTPLWAQMNYLFANYAFTWLIIPLLFQQNFWNAQMFPMYSTDGFNTNGTYYDISKVLDKDYRLNETEYASYSPLWLSPFWALSYGCSFAAMTATVIHVLLYHGFEIKENLYKETSDDIHTRMMRKYKSIPMMWFIFLLSFSLGLGILTVEYWKNEMQLKV